MAIEDHAPIVKSLIWVSEDQTRDFAQALAQRLENAAPDLNVCIELRGDLGAGKTTLVRHLLKALGVQGRIKSPTYAVVEPYSVSTPAGWTLNIWHFDFYRFNDPDEWEEAGFRDIFASPGLKLVEWPEKAGAHLPPADLTVSLALAENDERVVNLRASTVAGTFLLKP
jgi:tRNA threonylcarbamoyladenosine biosynthesis protein TsaE